MKGAVISPLCIVLAVGLTVGSPLFYERQNILNKVEFSDAGIDGARIDPLIDVSDEVEGNITVSSFTDTNDVGGNDSKEENDRPDDAFDEEVTTERTATEAALNGDSDEVADNARKVTGTASPRPVTLVTTKNSQTDTTNVREDKASVTTPGSVSSTTPGRVTSSTDENEVSSSRQSTVVGATSEKTVHSSQMPNETSTPPSSQENELEGTIKMMVNSATTTTTEAPENNTDSLTDFSEDTTTGQNFVDSATTSSMISSESTILATTESTNPTESLHSVSNEHSSVEETETTTFTSTVEGEENALSTSSLESTTNLIATTTRPTADAAATDGDGTTASAFETTLQVESSTLSNFTVLTTDSFREFSDTTVSPTTTGETTTFSSTPEMPIDSEVSTEVSLATSYPTTTMITETTSMEIVPTTVHSEEQRTTTEMQVNPSETTLGDAVTTSPAMVSSGESSEFTETTAKDSNPTTTTENVPGVTSEATVSVTQTLEEMSTFVTVGHSLESGEFLTTSAAENVHTPNAIVEELTSTVAAITLLNHGSDMETGVTSPDSTTTEVARITLSTDTVSSAEATAASTETELSTITPKATSVQDTVITTTEKFVQATTASLAEQSEETTTGAELENFSTTTDKVLTETSSTAEITTEELTTSRPTEIETTTTEEIFRETTTIAATYIEESATTTTIFATNIEENATIGSDVDQSSTTSKMMSGASVTVETPQETFTMVSESGEEAEFKKDPRTTAEPRTTIDSTETSTREIMEDFFSTTNVIITTVQPPEQISAVIADFENTPAAHMSDSAEDALTTTQQIETFTSTVVDTENVHDITKQEASATAAVDTTSVFFTEAVARTTAEIPEQSTTSVLDLADVTTVTAEETITQETAEELTNKNAVSINLVTTTQRSTGLASTSLAIEGHEENNEDRFGPELNELLNLTFHLNLNFSSEIITKESALVFVKTTDSTITLSAPTASSSNNEELEKGSEDKTDPQDTESTSSSSEMTTKENSLTSVEFTEPFTTLSASTTARNNIEDLEKGSEDESSPQHSESTTSTSEMTTKENSLVSVESTEPSTMLSASTTARSIIEALEKGSEYETSPQHIDSTSPSEMPTKDSSLGLVETSIDYTTVTETTVQTSTTFLTSTTPPSVAVSDGQLSPVTKETPVTSVTIRKELTEEDLTEIVSLASEAMITTTVLPATSPEKPGHPNVSESVQRSTKNITLQNPPEQSDDIAGATIPPEKELPSTSDALSTPAEDSGSTAHTIHHLLVLLPIVMVQLRNSLGASS